MGRGGGKGRVWKTKEGIMKTSGIVDRGEDTIRNVEKMEQEVHSHRPALGRCISGRAQGARGDLSLRQYRSLQYNL